MQRSIGLTKEAQQFCVTDCQWGMIQFVAT